MSAALLVADSGPLIALARLDLLWLPGRYFDSVLVTSSVWTEVTRKPCGDEAARLSAAAGCLMPSDLVTKALAFLGE